MYFTPIIGPNIKVNRKLSLLILFVMSILFTFSSRAGNLNSVFNAMYEKCSVNNKATGEMVSFWKHYSSYNSDELSLNISKLKNMKVKKKCEKSLLKITRGMAYMQDGQILPAIVLFSKLLKKYRFSKSEKTILMDQNIELKITAKQNAENNGHKINKKYQFTQEEQAIVDWRYFLNGKFTFADKEESFLSKLGSSLIRTRSNEIVTTEGFVENKEWEKLAKFVINNRKKGLDIDYYYLAIAAMGLGLKEPSLKYALTSIKVTETQSKKSCKRFYLTDGTRKYSYCGKHKLPQAAKRIPAQFKKEEQKKQKYIAVQEAARKAKAEQKVLEIKRREEQAKIDSARLAKIELLKQKYPEEWVDAILDNKVIKDMSKDAVIEAKGKPSKKELLGAKEMWTYGTNTIIFTGNTVSFISR